MYYDNNRCIMIRDVLMVIIDETSVRTCHLGLANHFSHLISHGFNQSKVRNV